MNELLALLNYMASHNKSHAVELSEMSDRLREKQSGSAAELVGVASTLLQEAGAKLDEAIRLVGAK